MNFGVVVVIIENRYFLTQKLESIIICVFHCSSVLRWKGPIKFACPSIRLSVCPYIDSSVYPSIYLSICPFGCPSVCLSVHLSIRPSVSPSVRTSFCPSVHPSICLCVTNPFISSLSLGFLDFLHEA